MDANALPKTNTEKPLSKKIDSFPKVIDESFAKPAPAAAAVTEASSSKAYQPKSSPNQPSKRGSSLFVPQSKAELQSAVNVCTKPVSNASATPALPRIITKQTKEKYDQVHEVSASASSSAPVFPTVVRDDKSGAEIEVICQNCYLVRQLLSMKEQVALFQYIEDRDQTPWSSLPKVMVPAPKTLMFGENQPVLHFEPVGEPSAIRDMVERASQLVERNRLQLITQDEENAHNINFCKYKGFSMAAIRYKAPHGRFPPHVDHCDSGYVFLMSLGCTANFMVKGPDMVSKHNFKFRSGDLLVFDSSTKASILHGVMSIDDLEESCPEALANAFPILKNHRYGVQCRVKF